MSNICTICGGYTGNGHIIRRLPATDNTGNPYPLADVPPVKLCACNKGIAGYFFVGEFSGQHYASDVPWVPPAMSEADLRAFVRKEVHAALDDLAREMQTNRAFQPVHTPSGICWACGEHGQDMMWYERGGRSHLIHSAVECVRAAEIKPEQREHKG